MSNTMAILCESLHQLYRVPDHDAASHLLHCAEVKQHAETMRAWRAPGMDTNSSWTSAAKASACAKNSVRSTATGALGGEVLEHARDERVAHLGLVLERLVRQPWQQAHVRHLGHTA